MTMQDARLRGSPVRLAGPRACLLCCVILPALLVTSCSAVHGPSADGGPAPCPEELDSPLACGACDRACDRNQWCVAGRCQDLTTQISVGASHLLVRTPEGELLGVGESFFPAILPDGLDRSEGWTTVRNLPGARLEPQSGGYACVTETGGRVACWGSNASLLLGAPTARAESFQLVRPALPEPVRELGHCGTQ